MASIDCVALRPSELLPHVQNMKLRKAKRVTVLQEAGRSVRIMRQ
jgi:hypothetical protein